MPDTEAVSAAAEVREQINAALAPLREQLMRVDELIAQNKTERAVLLQARRDLVGLFGRTATRARASTDAAQSKINTDLPLHREAREKLLAFIEASESDEFTAGGLYKDQRAQGLGLSWERVRLLVEEFHSSGVVRLDRAGRGGSRIYKRMSAER